MKKSIVKDVASIKDPEVMSSVFDSLIPVFLDPIYLKVYECNVTL